MWRSGNVEHEVGEERREIIVGTEWEDVGDVLIRSNDDDATVGPVDASAVEDVWAVVQLGAEDLLVVDEPEPALAREQKRRHGIDRHVSVGLLVDRTDVDHRVDVVACGGVTQHR